MGVPVVAFPQETHASRVASSVLKAAGHPEWIAASDEEYVKLARDLAADTEYLRQTRAGAGLRFFVIAPYGCTSV